VSAGAGGVSDVELDGLRLVGDEPADAVARALLTAYGAADETEVVGRAVRAVVSGLASPDDAVVGWLSAGPELPAWIDPELVAVGQRFFGAWPLPIATTLFCAALPTTYAAPHGAAVVAATSHLSRPGHVGRRLAETGRMIFDCLAEAPDGTLRPGGQGYVSARGVRLLHAVVRQALLSGRADPWPAQHGVPINQEDLLGTLLAFSVTVLDGLRKLRVPVGGNDAHGYIHAWCAVGALLGIDEALLPRTPTEARQMADRIAERQFGPSEAGRRLTGELLTEMRMAMPPGCRGLPAALMWRLVPEVAGLLAVPRPGRGWRIAIGATGAAARSVRGVPGLRALVTGPGAVVGRSVLQMCIDREQQPGGPPYRADAELLQRVVVRGRQGAAVTRRRRRRAVRRTDRRRRRGDTVGVGPHVGPTRRDALDALAHPLKLPIDVDDVRQVASEGFPLWEPGDAMVRRNRRITLCYWDLSGRLAHVVAGPDGILDANWCTFATWSSRTIGTYLEKIERSTRPGPRAASDIAGLPGPVPGATSATDGSLPERLALRAMRRGNSSGLRILAAANRAVFLDVGQSTAAFVERFPTRSSAAGDDGEAAWHAFWWTVEAQLEESSLLDPSWVLTPSPPPDDLRLAFRQYFAALRADDQHLRSQHVLAGNLLLAAYEQRRLDGYVGAALALSSARAMRRLIHDRTGAVGPPAGWANRLYARLMTRRMVLQLPGAELEVNQPITAPADPEDRWDDLATDAEVTLPVLQALITRYELAAGVRRQRGARDWTSFDQRMRTIGTLFRARQRQADLFGAPFDEVEAEQLLGCH